MREHFSRFAHAAALVTGSWPAFLLAVLVVVGWFACGFFVGFSNTIYQLAINTGTTIVTFLMVFLIQNTQNRDTRALHLKLDELLRAVRSANTGLVGLEDRSDADLDRLEDRFRAVRAHAQEADR